jgi:two-component system response regulator AtoC
VIKLKTIKVAGDLQYPPYEFVDKQGNYQGYNVKVMNYIATEKGIKMEFYPMSWEKAQQALLKGEVDIIQGMNYSPSRAQDYLFCLPTMMNNLSVFVPEDCVFLAKDMLVGLQEGDIGEDTIIDVEKQRIKKFETHFAGVSALIAGEIDAFIGNEKTIVHILENMGRTKQYKKLFTMHDNRAYCPVVRRNDQYTSEILNSAISKFNKSSKSLLSITPPLNSKNQHVYIDSPLEIIQETPSIIGTSQSMKDLMKVIDKIKDIDLPVLITGETGTGKELIVQEIHNQSKRRNNPLEAVNCAALPVNLLESELFGYEKGAFTGAANKYRGKFLLANGGTLFLDEIGEIEPAVQVKLLRALQDKLITPLGSAVSHKVNVRIIAATNKDLLKEVREGRFREDLYYRLNVIDIQTTPLRNRREDIPVLINYYLEKIAGSLQQDKKQLGFSVLTFLQEYKYPGNVRELINILERACALAEGDVIQMKDLSPYLLSENNVGGGNQETDGIYIKCGEPLDQVEEKVILMNLNKLKKNKKELAEILGISERALRYKLNKYYS